MACTANLKIYQRAYKEATTTNIDNPCDILSAESQKGIITIQQFSNENQKGANAIDFVQQ